METVLSKLQEGVKYPRFERDATRIINDLVTHVTKERGIYSSSIEPNPNEHSIWFNTNDKKIYTYIDGKWTIISGDRSFNINTDSTNISPYPTINILYDTNLSAECDSHNNYVIITSSNNIVNFINNVIEGDDYTILNGNDIVSGTFIIYINNKYVYYIKISDNYISENLEFYASAAQILIYYDGSDYIQEISGSFNKGDTKELVNSIILEHEEEIDDGLFTQTSIEPEDGSIIILGTNMPNNLTLAGDDVDDVTIYLFNNRLNFEWNDNINSSFNYYNLTIYANCVNIGDITISTSGDEYMDNGYIETINCIVGNNNNFKIEGPIERMTSELYLYVIDMNDNDNSSIQLYTDGYVTINDYVNLCKTPFKCGPEPIQFSNVYITTTLKDFQNEALSIDFAHSDGIVIIDSVLDNDGHMADNIMSSLFQANVYTTDRDVNEFLYREYNIQANDAVNRTVRYDNHIHIDYRTTAGKLLYIRDVYYS